MKNLLLLSLFSILGFYACSQQKTTDIDYSKALLVDVRTPQEFADGSAKGAVNIPLNEIQDRIAEFKTDRPIIVFCRSGARSARAEQILKQNGISNVTNGGTWMDVQKRVSGR